MRKAPRKRHFKGTFAHRLLGERLFDPQLWIPTQEEVAKGAALGLFLGILPIYGFQIATCIALGFLFRVNLSVAILATFITNPVTAPGIVFMQYRAGVWITSLSSSTAVEAVEGVHQSVFGHAKSLMVGSVLSAIVISAIGYVIVRWLWKGVSKLGEREKRILEQHHNQTFSKEKPHPDSKDQESA